MSKVENQMLRVNAQLWFTRCETVKVQKVLGGRYIVSQRMKDGKFFNAISSWPNRDLAFAEALDLVVA